jgi:hypothetical protein
MAWFGKDKYFSRMVMRNWAGYFDPAEGSHEKE